MNKKHFIIGMAIIGLLLSATITVVGYGNERRQKQVLFPDGTMYNPGGAFLNENGTGFWRPTNGNMVLVVMHSPVLGLSNSQITASSPLLLMQDNPIWFRSGNQGMCSQDAWNLLLYSNENLNLEAEHVTINGCDTLTGTIRAGEEITFINGLAVKT